jgi:hypothetical protein
MSLQACLNPPFKLFGSNELNPSIINIAGTAFGSVEPQGFCFLLRQVLQAV